MSEAAILVGENGRIIAISLGFEALAGWTEDELLGRSLDHIFADDGDERAGYQSIEAEIPTAFNTGGPTGTRKFRRRDGGYFRGVVVTLSLRGRGRHGQERLFIVHHQREPNRQTDDLMKLIAFVAEHSAPDDLDTAAFLDLGCRYFGCELGFLSAVDDEGGDIEAKAGDLAPHVSDQILVRWDRAHSGAYDDETDVTGGVQPSSTGSPDDEIVMVLVGVLRGLERCHGRLYFANRRGMAWSKSDHDQPVLDFMAQWLAAHQDAALTRRSYEQAHRQLRRSEKRYRSLYEKTPAILHSIDASGCLASVSDAWLERMGYAREEIIGRPSSDFLTAESRRYAQDVVLPEFRAVGHCSDIPYQFVAKNGDIRDMELSAISQCDDDGNFYRSLAVLLDVTERKQVERALIKKTAALERSNADLKRIAQIASHDLQEPLRRVITYCEILKEDFGTEISEGVADTASIIQSGGRRLRLRINDLLTYVRIREQLDRAFEPVDLAAVLCHVLEDLNDEITAKNVRVDAGHLPLVWGRAPLLKMVFHHLIGNAIKYGGAPVPVISVTVDDAGESWRFTVTDTGKGVEPRFADRIFEIFRRLHHDDDYEGSGAGLANCQLIIQRCGGDIWLDRGYEGGARFLFTLPKENPNAA